MVRTKAVAVLLGPSGVEFVGLSVSITGLVSNIARLCLLRTPVMQAIITS